MSDELKLICILGLIIIFGLLAFMLPICICVEHGKQREFELEKYKIEMEYKRGDVNNE